MAIRRHGLTDRPSGQWQNFAMTEDTPFRRPSLTAEDVVRRIAAECAFVDERGGVGIRLRPAIALVPVRRAILRGPANASATPVTTGNRHRSTACLVVAGERAQKTRRPRRLILTVRGHRQTRRHAAPPEEMIFHRRDREIERFLRQPSPTTRTARSPPSCGIAAASARHAGRRRRNG